MYKIENFENHKFISVPKLSKLGLKHCFTTKDLNMRIGSSELDNGSVNDYKKILKFLNRENSHIFLSQQKHTDHITVVDKLDLGYPHNIGRLIENNDGLITSMSDVCLVSQYADCTPIILFDSKNKVHANIHSGWRGSLAKISKNAIESMIENYGSDPENIYVVLGPSISKDDFEVEKDVAELFYREFKNLDNFIFKKNSIKYLIDLNRVNIHVLLEAKIPLENIINIDLSTYSNDLFHSYRLDPKNYGLMALFTCL